MNTQQDIQALRILVRAREDFQAQRKRMDNRIGRKADGTDQAIDERPFIAEDLESFLDISEESRKQEKAIENKLKKMLKRFDVYNEFLKDVKGVGEIAASHIISNIDIDKATTVSKIWQYCGLNPGMIRGKKRVQTTKPETYQPQNPDWEVVKRGEDHVVVVTDEMIRGDKLAPGFISPFNKGLKCALLGVLASGFIKSQSSYALDFYYPYKERLANSSQVTKHREKGKTVELPWKDVTPGHRDMAAKRYMIKMFLRDLYVAWRGLEGLPIRESYQEEYLGKIHKVA